MSVIQRSIAWAAFLLVPSTIAGCGFFGAPFAPGTYSGDIPCTLRIVGASGAEGEQEYTSAISVTTDAEGNVSVNSVELIVGAEVLRSIPTADLAFEVTKITRDGRLLRVEYAPRPTLVGITVEGELVESYLWDGGSIEATGETDLIITDAEGATTLTVNCEGALAPK